MNDCGAFAELAGHGIRTETARLRLYPLALYPTSASPSCKRGTRTRRMTLSATSDAESIENANAQGEKSATGYSWYVLFVLVIVYILNFIDRQIVSILAVDIKADLGLTDADMGFLGGAAFAVFYALFGIPLGRLADNWSRVRLL